MRDKDEDFVTDLLTDPNQVTGPFGASKGEQLFNEIMDRAFAADYADTLAAAAGLGQPPRPTFDPNIPSSQDQYNKSLSELAGDLKGTSAEGSIGNIAQSKDAQFDAEMAKIGNVNRENLGDVIDAAEKVYGAGDSRGITQVLGKTAEAGLTMEDIEIATGATEEDVKQVLDDIEKDDDKIYSTGESREGGSIYDVLGGIGAVIFGGGKGDNGGGETNGGDETNGGNGGGETVQDCSSREYALLHPCECDAEYAAENPDVCAADPGTVIINGPGTDGGVGSTPGICSDPNSSYDLVTQTCVCNAGFTEVNGVCVQDTGGEDEQNCSNASYAEQNPCECVEGYAEQNPCECVEGYAEQNPDECPSVGLTGCLDPVYAATHPCECVPGYASSNPDECGQGGDEQNCSNALYAEQNPCECVEGYAEQNPDECPSVGLTGCLDPVYAAANPCECVPGYASSNPGICGQGGDEQNCSNPLYAEQNPCECVEGYAAANPDKCPNVTLEGCLNPVYAAANPCECVPGYASSNPGICGQGEKDDPCDNEVYARENPSICAKDCPPGFVKVLGACIPLITGNGSCPEGQVKDANGNCVTECPAGFIDDGGQCVSKTSFCSLYPNDPRCVTDQPGGNGGLTPPTGLIPGAADFVTRDDVLVEFDKPDYDPYSILPAPATEPYLAGRRPGDIAAAFDVLGFRPAQGLEQRPETMERVERYTQQFGVGPQDAPTFGQAAITPFEDRFGINIPDVSRNFPVRPTEPISQPRYNPLTFGQEPEQPTEPLGLFARGGVAESSDGIGSLMERRAGAVNRMLLNKAGMNFGRR